MDVFYVFITVFLVKSNDFVPYFVFLLELVAV